MSQTIIKEAVEVLRNGGIIVYPTETVYGIGCDPFNKEAYEKVRGLKNRLGNKPMLLVACSRSQVEEYAGKMDGTALKLAAVFWPGSLTMVIKPIKEFPDYLYGSSNGVAFRVTSHPVAASLAYAFGKPIISTSANITGQPPVTTYEKALELFKGKVDIILKTDEQLNGKPSTIVDLTKEHFTILREGSIIRSRIEEML